MHVKRLLEKYAAGVKNLVTGEIRFDPSFRVACESNACGFYGACWMCPPDVGDMQALIALARSYAHALVFQTVHSIEDSYDIEGMSRASKAHNHLIVRLRRALLREGVMCLALGAGACGGCGECAKKRGEACRHPERAVIPLEAAGIDVVALAKTTGLPYINGKNTVTYFGALLTHDAIEF